MSQNKDSQHCIRVMAEDYDYLKRVAEKMDVPKGQLVRNAIRYQLFKLRGKLSREMIVKGGSPRNGEAKDRPAMEGLLVVMITKDDRERLNGIAEATNTSISEVIRYGIKLYIEELKELEW